ncbi:CBS domain-containing protein [Rathayibacter sp. VKM Ac-2856]|uniref:CBS domain-containing protein n=1 Tax=unclassified Rathayibacter TaxID=2609250 RepID=UPI001565F9DE|nr:MULTISPECIES: CBS domain-containing protein [unclassified Rathayibacter]NQX03242.1 CBS domain-containing protein [Rathayibacter sp. VKM Ac-2858]NQX18410.1 CBS domain-containing protein [Rathayibacter sp. VKM Ac-2856]
MRAREIMSPEAECVGEDETLQVAAQKMRDLDVGALPICGSDKRLKGVITDRDIVVRVVAEGKDPSTETASSLAGGETVTIGADDDVQVALDVMRRHQVRRLPVIDGHDLVGMIAQADIARALDASDVGETVAEISDAS